jgi:anti-sigma factor RsiW
VTPPRRPGLEAEEEVLLSALLDDELAPEDRERAEALLLARPEAVEWLAAARCLGEVGRGVWEELAEFPVAASVADPGVGYRAAYALAPSANGRARFGPFRWLRRGPGDGSSGT